VVENEEVWEFVGSKRIPGVCHVFDDDTNGITELYMTTGNSAGTNTLSVLELNNEDIENWGRLRYTASYSGTINQIYSVDGIIFGNRKSPNDIIKFDTNSVVGDKYGVLTASVLKQYSPTCFLVCQG